MGLPDQYWLEQVLVTSNQQPRELDFHGLPTVLVDGKDLFGGIKEQTGLSCQRYEKTIDGKTYVVSSYPDREVLRELLIK